MSLEYLYLGGNRLICLPIEMGYLPRLSALYLHNNRIQHVPPAFRPYSSHGAVKLCGIMQSVPDKFPPGNQLLEMPIQFTMLTRLVHLNLGANKITAIPHTISQLMSLEYLYLGGNRLICLPIEMGYLPRLSALYLHNNRIQHVPPAFRPYSSHGAVKLCGIMQSVPDKFPQATSNVRGISLSYYLSLSLSLYLSLSIYLSLSLSFLPLSLSLSNSLSFPPLSISLYLSHLSLSLSLSLSIPYSKETLPTPLVDYLDSAKRCVNPECVQCPLRFEEGSILSEISSQSTLLCFQISSIPANTEITFFPCPGGCRRHPPGCLFALQKGIAGLGFENDILGNERTAPILMKLGQNSVWCLIRSEKNF
eukprot:sb/3465943/